MQDSVRPPFSEYSNIILSIKSHRELLERSIVMKKKSKVSNPNVSTESNPSQHTSVTASSLTQEGYTKKQGCGCGKKKA